MTVLSAMHDLTMGRPLQRPDPADRRRARRGAGHARGSAARRPARRALRRPGDGATRRRRRPRRGSASVSGARLTPPTAPRAGVAMPTLPVAGSSAGVPSLIGGRFGRPHDGSRTSPVGHLTPLDQLLVADDAERSDREVDLLAVDRRLRREPDRDLLFALVFAAELVVELPSDVGQIEAEVVERLEDQHRPVIANVIDHRIVVDVETKLRMEEISQLAVITVLMARNMARTDGMVTLDVIVPVGGASCRRTLQPRHRPQC